MISPTDTPSSMHGMAKVTVRGQTMAFAAFSEDLPAPEFVNRFHLLLHSDELEASRLMFARRQLQVRVDATSRGTMTIDAPGFGYVEFFPAGKSVRQWQREHAPGSETRRQYLTVRPDEDGWEILIEEPISESSVCS